VNIARSFKGLCAGVPIYYAFGPRIEGYALAGGKKWVVPGSDIRIRNLHELYTLSDQHYNGRATVPVLWDSLEQRMVSNESADIMRAFGSVQLDQDGAGFRLVPLHLEAAIDAANAEIYDGLNNAVYQAGFAQSQEAYDAAVKRVFITLDRLEARLSKSRFYFGATITETDLRLFPTLCRFDAIYYILFKCSYRRLVDYPALWAYARDLFQTKSIGRAVNFDLMCAASYANDGGAGHSIVAVRPDADWSIPHGREGLGSQPTLMA
jgi:putative glutathione S-transferase